MTPTTHIRHPYVMIGTPSVTAPSPILYQTPLKPTINFQAIDNSDTISDVSSALTYVQQSSRGAGQQDMASVFLNIVMVHIAKDECIKLNPQKMYIALI